MPVQLVTVGHVLCETIVFADGRREGPVLGSPAAYSAAVAARLGIPTGIITKVGPDAPGGLLQPLVDAGVDLAGIDRTSLITTTNQLVYAPDGTKELKYLKQASAITIDDVIGIYRQAEAFHVCPLDYEVSVDTAREIAGLGKLMSVDLGGYGGAHVRRETYAKKRLSSAELMTLIRCFHVVKASDEDARLLFPDEGLSDEASAQRLVDWGAKVGIITRGSKGSVVFTPNKKYEVPAIPGQVVDVTGGGDSYVAGFWAKYLPTQDPEQAALFASAVALCVIEKGGGVRAQRMPTSQEAARKITPGYRAQLL
jgi:fructokinase